MIALLNQDPVTAATELIGKKLLTNEQSCIVRGAEPQNPTQNHRWRKKPLFGDNPVDAYVSSYRGIHLLFLRTGEANTCVKVTAICLNDQLIEGPGRVTKALGLDSEQSGDVIDEGNYVRIVWR